MEGRGKDNNGVLGATEKINVWVTVSSAWHRVVIFSPSFSQLVSINVYNLVLQLLLGLVSCHVSI